MLANVLQQTDPLSHAPIEPNEYTDMPVSDAASGLLTTILQPIAANLSGGSGPITVASTERLLRHLEFTTMASATAVGGGDSPVDPPNISMDDLYPALVKCFGIIVCG